MHRSTFGVFVWTIGDRDACVGRIPRSWSCKVFEIPLRLCVRLLLDLTPSWCTRFSRHCCTGVDTFLTHTTTPNNNNKNNNTRTYFPTHGSAVAPLRRPKVAERNVFFLTVIVTFVWWGKFCHFFHTKLHPFVTLALRPQHLFQRTPL